jgi:predicted DNA-binding WGR domain protein
MRDTRTMQTDTYLFTCLTRRNPELNMARFYGIALQPTLFGETSVIRAWGRIGTRGRARIDTFGHASDARVHAEMLERVKRRRGYS